jgi:VWFA-related protein
MRVRSRYTTALFLSCFIVAGFAQQAAVLPPTGPERRVWLDVVVTDKSGKPVSGLQQQDFTVLDDKQPQAILSFRANDAPGQAADPTQVILLIDTVNTPFQAVSNGRVQLEKFLRRDDGQLPVPTSLIFLTDTSAEQSLTTRDGNALADALNSKQGNLRIIGRSQGFYGAVDRIQISINALEKLAGAAATHPGRTLVVWVSPGWPLLSGPNAVPTEKGQESLFKTVVSLSTELRQSRVTLYDIDPLGMADAGSTQTFYYGKFLKGVSSANQVQGGNLALQVLALQSGGRVLNSANDLVRSITSCLLDAKVFYTLSFESPRADHPNEYHTLQVKMGKSGLTARTRTGYYAQR